MNTAPAPDTTLTVGTMYFHWARHVDTDRRLCLCRVRPRTALAVRIRHGRGGSGIDGEHHTGHGTFGLDNVLPLNSARAPVVALSLNTAPDSCPTSRHFRFTPRKG